MALEKELQTTIFKKYGALPWLKIWRCNTGSAIGVSFIMKAKRLGYFPDNMPITRYGVIGMPDIMGIIAPAGRLVGIEVKSPTGRQTPEQKLWQKVITDLGGLYILAKHIDDITEALQHDQQA